MSFSSFCSAWLHGEEGKYTLKKINDTVFNKFLNIRLTATFRIYHALFHLFYSKGDTLTVAIKNILADDSTFDSKIHTRNLSPTKI